MMPSTDPNFYQPVKPQPIQRVMASAFPDNIQIESALDLPGQNPVMKRPKGGIRGAQSSQSLDKDGEKQQGIPFNNEICSVSKTVYLDLGPATRLVAPTAQVYCSQAQKQKLKAASSKTTTQDLNSSESLVGEQIKKQFLSELDKKEIK